MLIIRQLLALGLSMEQISQVLNLGIEKVRNMTENHD